MPRVQTNYFVLEICNKILMSVLWCILLIMTLFDGKISIDGIANLKKLLIMCLLDSYMFGQMFRLQVYFQPN